MPSDPRVTRALTSLAVPIAQYRAAVTATLEEIRGYVAAGRSNADARAERLRGQLGPFAGGRVDPGRLARLLGDGGGVDEVSLGRLERAADTLRSLGAGSDSLFFAAVPAGGRLPECAAGLLATIGRAFAAARVAAAARGGRPAEGLDEELALYSFPFAEWTTAERRLAAPIVVTVDGADLNAGALAPLLDGGQKILLIVDGPCAPAPLARLITPGVFVMQAHDSKELDRLGDWPGAGIGALVPASCARFVHDPAAGHDSWQRLTVEMPAGAQIGRINGLSAAQQKDELHHLLTLAAPPQTAAAAPDAAQARPAAEPADRLASWLLQQAGLAPPNTGT